jgi:hypothetical protein
MGNSMSRNDIDYASFLNERQGGVHEIALKAAVLTAVDAQGNSVIIRMEDCFPVMVEWKVDVIGGMHQTVKFTAHNPTIEQLVTSSPKLKPSRPCSDSRPEPAGQPPRRSGRSRRRRLGK